MKCLNVIVYYENPEEVREYILETLSIGHGMVDILVVVNRDEAQKAAPLIKELGRDGKGQVRTADYGGNVGYLNALLKSMQTIDPAAYDYVILSNTDIHYETRDLFQILSERDYPADVGCIAPSVFNTQSKSYSNPHYMERVPKEKLERLIRIFQNPTLAGMYLKLAGLKSGRTKAEKKPSCYVYSPHGCYMIFTGDFLSRIRGYEYGVKMYSEESAVGELLRRNGLRCYYDDGMEVIHQESSVTGSMNSRARFQAWRDSLIYIVQEFYT